MDDDQNSDESADARTKAQHRFPGDHVQRVSRNWLVDQQRLYLNPKQYDAFADALGRALPPGPKLRALMRRIPAWET